MLCRGRYSASENRRGKQKKVLLLCQFGLIVVFLPSETNPVSSFCRPEQLGKTVRLCKRNDAHPCFSWGVFRIALSVRFSKSKKTPRRERGFLSCSVNVLRKLKIQSPVYLWHLLGSLSGSAV